MTKLNLENYSMERKVIKTKNKLINRELSWLSFNERVLACANNKNIPLNQRLMFLSITCTNLDEFISVRYAGAMKDSHEPVKEISDKIQNFMQQQETCYRSLKKELELNKIFISKVKDLSKNEKQKIENIFTNDIFPMLTPISVGSVNDMPTFYSGQNCICATIKVGELENLVIIPISKQLQSMYKIGNKLVMIEDIIEAFADNLFINKKINSYGYFRVIKDASIVLSHDESKYLLDRMIDTIEDRELASPIYLEVASSTPNRLIKILKNVFNIKDNNVYKNDSILDYSRFGGFNLTNYSYKNFTPNVYETMGEQHSLFTEIRRNDILLHHPYDSYDTVVKFIEHASVDPKVLAIKQTLYRVSSEDSPIVNALCRAAKNGKFVVVLIEIKARFDESRNISLINKLQRAGVNVLLGLEYLKTHCKMCIVVRKEKDELRLYSHMGTGNYNEKTAKQYTDISYFTCKQKVGMDLLNIFNILSGISTPDEKLQRVFYAPINLRKKLLKNISREISHVKKGKDARIFLKLNSINDPEIINSLYEAADKGVKVYIICRGITCLTPRKNLYIKSIVGRFLEHSRIYYFYNDKKEEYYISSADMLTRNLDKRVETLVQITDKECIHKLKDIIDCFKKDEANSFIMQPDGKYIYLKKGRDCHQDFIDVAENKVKLKYTKKRGK